MRYVGNLHKRRGLKWTVLFADDGGYSECKEFGSRQELLSTIYDYLLLNDEAPDETEAENAGAAQAVTSSVSEGQADVEPTQPTVPHGGRKPIKVVAAGREIGNVKVVKRRRKGRR